MEKWSICYDFLDFIGQTLEVLKFFLSFYCYKNEDIFLFDWDSFHARLNSNCEAKNYKKKKKKMIKAYMKSV